MLVSPTWEPVQKGCLKLEVQCPLCEWRRLCLDVVLFQGIVAKETLELECLQNFQSANLMVNVSNAFDRFGVIVKSSALNDSTDAIISNVLLLNDTLCLEPSGIFKNKFVTSRITIADDFFWQSIQAVKLEL